MDHEFPEGAIIDGRYEIVALAGLGGMGAVYRAKQLDLARIVAIKTLDPALVSSEELRERFKREARVLATLVHPNISMFYNYGILETGQPYIAMEYVDGVSLQKTLNDHGALNPARTITIALQICGAMEMAHKAAVIHRDLKPANILLLPESESERVKLLDFGLAKLEADSEKLKLTKTGELIGTPEFLSPEQCLGKKATERSDIYALGCIIYKMLTNRPPFDADSPIGLISKHINEAPLALSAQTKNLPPGLENVVMKCLEKEENSRYQSMHELKQDLLTVQSGKAPSGLEPPFVKDKKNRRFLRTASIVSLAVLGSLILFSIMKHQKSVNSARIHKDGASLKEAIIVSEKEKQYESEAKLLTELENNLRLSAASSAERASLFCNTARYFADKKAAKAASKFALLTFTEIASSRQAIPTTASEKTGVIGVGRTMLDRFFASKEGIKKSYSEVERNEQAIEQDFSQTLEDAATILSDVQYTGDRRLWQQCSSFSMSQAHAQRRLKTSNLANLLIRAYRKGAIPLSQSVIFAFETRDTVYLKTGKENQFDLAAPETLKAMKEFYGPNSMQIPNSQFSMMMGIENNRLLSKLYESGKRSLSKAESGENPVLAARCCLMAGGIAFNLGKRSDALAFASKSNKIMQENPDEAVIADTALLEARIFFEMRDYKKCIAKADKATQYYGDQKYRFPYAQSEADLMKARALMELGRTETAIRVMQRQTELLEPLLPDSNWRLGTITEIFAGVCRDKGLDREARSGYISSMRIWEKYGSDRVESIAFHMIAITELDVRIGDPEKIDETWFVISKINNASWLHFIRDSESPRKWSHFALEQKKVKIVKQFAEKVEDVAVQSLKADRKQPLFLANAYALLVQLEKQAQAERLKPIFSASLNGKDRTEFFRLIGEPI